MATAKRTRAQSAYLGIPEAATHLGVDTRTIRRFIAERKLPAYRLGNKLIRIKREDVQKLLVPVLPVDVSA